MKYPILIMLLSFSAHAEFKVSEFGNFCGGEEGCQFATQRKCERWLTRNHEEKPLTDCIDVTAQEATRREQREARRARKEQLLNFLKTRNLTKAEYSDYIRIKNGMNIL